MSKNGEHIQRQMQQLREDLGADADQLARARQALTDWRTYVQAYPWLCVGGAAALGYLLVPSSKVEKIKIESESDEAATAQAAAGGTMLGFLAATAGRTLVSYATQAAVRTLQEHRNRSTPTAPFAEQRGSTL